MTSIDFYTHVSDRFEVVTKLVAKAFARHGSVRVLTPDAEATATLDRLLWIQPAIGFLPHCRVDSRLAPETPIWVDHVLDHQGPAAVLINLHEAPPPFFARFERLAEVVGTDETETAAARERFRFYRERGYELITHNLSERG
ncbi:MAG: DNA polymerase III subunit chi [Burkholderiales bacterium]|jgi:DNA polymerase-3 subunit chi